MAGMDERWLLSGGVKSSRLEYITTEVDSIIAEVYLSKIRSDVYMNRLSASGYSFDIKL
jgi:hypothetical protein